MIRDKKEMLNFEEVDKIRMFWGIDKGMILERGINRIIVKCKLQSLVIKLPHFLLELIES